VVLVDGTYAAQQGSTDKKYTPRSEEEVRQFEDMVKKAVGYSQDRGDEVKVVNMPFEVAPQEEIAETGGGVQSAMPMIMTGAKFAIPLVGLVLLFVMVIKPLMKTLTSMPAQRPVLAPQIAAEMQKAISAPERSSQEQLIAWAKSNPKEATSLIKGWLEEK
jgi:flagellar M-ring protein FliF